MRARARVRARVRMSVRVRVWGFAGRVRETASAPAGSAVRAAGRIP